MPLFTKSSTWQSDEHQMFADMAARFYQDELVPRIDTWNANGVVERDFWTKAGAAGLMIAATAPLMAKRSSGYELKLFLTRSSASISSALPTAKPTRSPARERDLEKVCITSRLG